MPSTEELRAALEVAELEEKLIAEKAADDDNRATPETKTALREARIKHRTMRSGRDAGPDTARPDTVATSTTVNGDN